MDYYAYYYAYPFFQQSWTLFTPPPDCNYRLFADFSLNGKAKQVEILSTLAQNHNNRLLGNEPVTLAIANSIHYFEKASPHQEKINGPANGDKNFKILEHSVRRYLQHEFSGSLTGLKLMLEVTPINGKPRRLYYN